MSKLNKLNNNQERYFHIDSVTSTDQIFVLLNTVQSYNEDKIGKLMNVSDTKLIASKEIKITDNPDSARNLTTEANVHVVDEGRPYAILN